MNNFRTRPLPARVLEWIGIWTGIWIAAWVLLAPTATAQQEPHAPAPLPPDSLKTSRLSGFVGYVWDFFSSNYAIASGGAVVDATACGAYQRGEGTSIEAGVGYAKDFGAKFGLRGVLGFRKGNFQQSFNCTDPAQILTPNGTSTAITRFVNTIDLSTIWLTALADVQPFPFPLRVGVGPGVAVAIGQEYSAREEVVTPANAEFLEGGQSRSIGAGSGDGNRIAIAADAEISLPIIAGTSLRLLPSVAVRRYLTSPISWTPFSWTSISLRIGAEYQFWNDDWNKPAVPAVAELPFGQPIPEQPIAPAPPPPSIPLRFSATWKEPGGDTATVQQLRIVRQQILPLLPFIFFDSGSVAIPERYRLRNQVGRQPGEIGSEIGGEIAAAIRLHREVLDTIGARLRATPQANIRIAGTAPDAPAAEAIGVATARAAAVAEYLSAAWGIERGRIAISGKVMPDAPTLSTSAEGAAENIRAEISSGDPAILAPIIFRDTTMPAATAVIAGTVFPGSDSLLAVELRRESGAAKRLATRSSSGETIVVEGVVEPPSGQAETAAETIERVELAAITRDRGAGVAPSSGPLYLRTQLRQKVVLEALALFPFGSARLAAKDAEAIRQLRRLVGDSTATATLIGSTDDLGEASGNLQLSRSRAAAVADVLNLPKTRTEGLGEAASAAVLRYPEERMYARSVRARIAE